MAAPFFSISSNASAISFSSSFSPPLQWPSTRSFSLPSAAIAPSLPSYGPTFQVGYPVKTDALDPLYEQVKPKGVTMTAKIVENPESLTL